MYQTRAYICQRCRKDFLIGGAHAPGSTPIFVKLFPFPLPTPHTRVVHHLSYHHCSSGDCGWHPGICLPWRGGKNPQREYISLTSHTLHRERKSLVTLQPSSCLHNRNMEFNYVPCLVDVSIVLPNRILHSSATTQ